MKTATKRTHYATWRDGAWYVEAEGEMGPQAWARIEPQPTAALAKQVSDRIVVALNSHDALVEACRKIVQSAGYESGEAEPTLRELNVSIDALNQARAAIAKVERP